MRSRIAGQLYAGCALVLGTVIGCTSTNVKGGGTPGGQRTAAYMSETPASDTPFVAEKETAVAGSLPDVLGGPFGDPLDTTIHSIRPTPLMQMKFDAMSDEQFVHYVDTLIYELEPPRGELALLDCIKGNQPCGTKRAPVYVQPEIGFDSLKLESIGENGVIAARFINYDTEGRREKAFRIPPHSYAWLLVEKTGQDSWSARVVARDTAGGKIVLTSRPIGPFKNCSGHSRSIARRATAKWWNCNQQEAYSLMLPAPEPRSPFSFAAFATARMQDSIVTDSSIRTIRDGSVWITCSLGCCIAQ